MIGQIGVGESGGVTHCSANSVSKSESSSFEGGETAWKAGTLPAELLPLALYHFSKVISL